MLPRPCTSFCNREQATAPIRSCVVDWESMRLLHQLLNQDNFVDLVLQIEDPSDIEMLFDFIIKVT